MLEDKIRDRLEQLRDEIVANIEQKGITASGRTQRSIEVVKYPGGVMLVARAGNRAPIPTLEVGRPAGNVPGGMRRTKEGKMDVSNVFKAILVQWAKDKGLTDFGWGQATVLGRRIAAEGTLRNKQHEDVYSSAVREAAKDIEGIVLASVKETIKTNI